MMASIVMTIANQTEPDPLLIFDYFKGISKNPF
jgi:hypothetical protein